MKIDKYYGPSPSADDHPVQEAKEEHHRKADTLGARLDSLMEKKYVVLGLAILIIVINIILRTGLLQYQGLFEPDGFFYYAVIKQAIANHYVVSNYLQISGFPSHNFIGEAPGLPYLTVIGYYLLHGITGLSALTIMRWMPILFGVIYAIFGYFLAKYLSNSKALGLLAMLFLGLSSGNIARTAGTVYRGDSFITFFLMLAFILMFKCYEEKNQRRKYLWAVIASVVLSLGIVVWNGSPFIIVIYMLALFLITLYGFIKAELEILFSSLLLSAGLLLMHLLQLFYISIDMARMGLQLAGNDFFIFWLPILLVSALSYYIIKHIHKFRVLSAAKTRSIAVVVLAVVGSILMIALFFNTLINLASPINPIIAPTNVTNSTAIGASITATTQELQKPTYGFLWSSFNFQLFLAPLGVALFLIFAYLIYKNNRFIKRDHFNFNPVAFLALAAYFLVATAYLQYSAIRFNAIISVPLAIFAAFGVYAIAKLFWNVNIKNRILTYLILICLLVLVLLAVYFFYPTAKTAFSVVSGTIILACVLLVLLFCYSLYLVIYGHFNLKYIILGIILIILVFNFYNTYFESYTATQADGINPQFLQAMTWLRNNTASNATVLALWPDGSVVEGWGNRTSYMDSVGGENSSKIYPFSKFLFNTTDDAQYLYSAHKPDYLIARNFWYEELGGIAQEGLIQNSSLYGYIIMNGLNSSTNGTAQFFTFTSDSYPYYKAEMVVQPGPVNGSTRYIAYLGEQNSTHFTLMRQIIFFNTTSSAYNMVSTGNATNSINFTLMVSYSGRDISGAYVLGQDLVQSNVFKFTFLCNQFTCPYNKNPQNVTLTQVYSNGDTRIFKINYPN